MTNRGPSLARRLMNLMVRAMLCFGVVSISSHARAEHVKLGIVKVASATYIAVDKGYFAAEGLEPELVFFDVAAPIASAIVSGDLDFGVTGLSAGFYNLAGRGALKIISGGTRVAPTFNDLAIVASNGAFAAGLTSVKDFPNHSVAISQFGTPVHYALGLLAEKYSLDLKSMRILPLQTNPNQVSALVGGSADVAIVPGTYVLPAIDRGDIKLLGWVGDEVQWQNGVVFASTKTVNQRKDTVQRFLRAFGKAVHDYRDAFIAPNGTRRDEATAPEALAIIAKYVGQPTDLIRRGLLYQDIRLDVKDVMRQIAWYKSQGMLKEEVNGAELIDMRYVVPAP